MLSLVKYTCMSVSLLWIVAAMAQPDDGARKLFASNHQSIFQIRVMDNAANNKSSTGSGFLVNENGILATNYHVVASAVDLPDKYRIEVLTKNDAVILAELLTIDVVNDLALLKIDAPNVPILPVAASPTHKGETVYSMGYPFDLGITVVPGTYNGLAPHSANKRVHFTGSLNPGMSGGPAFNSEGEVIGVNVSTAGNQLSFLVPVDSLTSLISSVKSETVKDFKLLATQQLERNSKRLIDQLLAGNWSTVPLGGAYALDEVTTFLRCWGESKKEIDPKDKTPFWAQRSCQTDHNIYVKPGFTTGKIELQFYWIESEHLNSIHFYNYYSRIFGRYRPGNFGKEQDLGNWACEVDFVAVDKSETKLTKAVFCARGYKEFKGIYDVLFLQGIVSEQDKAHMIHFTLSGVTMESAIAFTERFVEAGVW